MFYELIRVIYNLLCRMFSDVLSMMLLNYDVCNSFLQVLYATGIGVWNSPMVTVLGLISVAMCCVVFVYPLKIY